MKEEVGNLKMYGSAAEKKVSGLNLLNVSNTYQLSLYPCTALCPWMDYWNIYQLILEYDFILAEIAGISRRFSWCPKWRITKIKEWPDSFAENYAAILNEADFTLVFRAGLIREVVVSFSQNYED